MLVAIAFILNQYANGSECLAIGQHKSKAMMRSCNPINMVAAIYCGLILQRKKVENTFIRKNYYINWRN